MYGSTQIKFATGHCFLLPSCMVVPASALATYSQTTLKGKAAKRKHELLGRVVSLPWKHWIEAVRPDLGPVLRDGHQEGVLRGGRLARPCEGSGGHRGLGRPDLPSGQGTFVHRGRCLSRSVFAQLKAHQLWNLGTLLCGSPMSAGSGKRADDLGRRRRWSSSGPLGPFAPTSAPVLGGPVNGQRGRQSGQRAPIGQWRRDRGGARGHFSLRWAGPAPVSSNTLTRSLLRSSDLMNNQRSSENPVRNWAYF